MTVEGIKTFYWYWLLGDQYDTKGDSRYKKFIDICFVEVKRVLRPYSDKFSKKTYTQHQHAVAILLMKREAKSYRAV